MKISELIKLNIEVLTCIPNLVNNLLFYYQTPLVKPRSRQEIQGKIKERKHNHKRQNCSIEGSEFQNGARSKSNQFISLILKIFFVRNLTKFRIQNFK